MGEGREMKSQKFNSARPSIVAFIVSMSLVAIGILIGFVTPDGYNASPSVMYQQGMAHICSGVFMLLGGIGLLMSSVLSIRRAKLNCKQCGVKITSAKDKFCRTCGSVLK